MRLGPLLLIVIGVSTSAVAACHGSTLNPDANATEPTAPTPDDGAVDGEVGEGSPPIDGSQPAPPSGLPCDVDALLKSKCQVCHDREHTNAPMALVTYEDLSAAWEGGSVAEAALAEMRSGAMPIGQDKATARELAAFGAWIDAGTPRGSCGSADAGALSITDDGGAVYPTLNEPDRCYGSREPRSRRRSSRFPSTSRS